VTDHYGAEASRNFTLTVENVNSPPKIAGDDTVFEVEEDSAFTHRFVATDPDLEIGQDSLSWSVNSTLFAISADGWVNWTPDDKDVGARKFTLTVKDQSGLKDTLEFTVNVAEHEEAPVAGPVGNLTVDEDTNVSFKVNVTDQDLGDVFTYSSDWALLTINKTGWVSFRADDRDIGVHFVNITVKDRANLAATVSFTITIRPVNEAPAGVAILGPANGTKFKQGALVSFSGNASDVDGDALNYTWYSDGEVIGYGKSLSTKALKPGKHAITLTVSDGSLSASSGALMIEIAKKPETAAKGFLPGFEMAAALAAGLMVALALRRRIC